MPSTLLHIVAHPSSGYRQRTKHNADSAGLTVAIAADYASAGERLTKTLAGARYLAVPIEVAADKTGVRIAKAMRQLETRSLNIAGNGIYTLSKHGYKQDLVNQHVYEAIAAAHGLWPIEKIVTGGQTGVDIAGAIAAHKIGIACVVTMPQGFVQRGLDKIDLPHSAKQILQQVQDGSDQLRPVDQTIRTHPGNHPLATSARRVELRDSITREMVRSAPDALFVFGDNDQRSGFSGQAKAMRGEPNSIGVRTKAAPSTTEQSYWSDETLAQNIGKIDEDFARIDKHEGLVVLPSAGLGTGLSQLQTRAPRTLAYIAQKIAALNPAHSLGDAEYAMKREIMQMHLSVEQVSELCKNTPDDVMRTQEEKEIESDYLCDELPMPIPRY